MSRPAADENTTREETVDRWPKQARHKSQIDRLRMRGEELAVAAPVQDPCKAFRTRRRDGLTTTAAAAAAAGRGAGLLELPFSTC
jgi:hypothetical protein